MPKPHQPLPPDLAARPFMLSEATARGLSRGRLSEADVMAPFNGVRSSTKAPLDQAALVQAFALRRPPGHFLSHTTALLLWGAPLPFRVERQPTIHVSSLGPVTPRAVRTTGHTLDPCRTRVVFRDGVPRTDPATSWVQSAALLPLDDLVAAGDFLITGTEPYDRSPPPATRDALAEAVDAHAGARGIRRAREALSLLRYGPLSRQETFLRLMLVRLGLPEPQLNYDVIHPQGGRIAMVDLAFPEERVAVEYESLLHQEPGKFRRDIRKQQQLEGIDWRLHRVTSDDVDPQLRTRASRAAGHLIVASLQQRGWNASKPRNGA